MTSPRLAFEYNHRVQFYETDTMGVVHHTNYLRFCEEARVAWAHSVGLIDYQKPESASHFAVVETRVRHLKPVQFGDIVKIFIQAKCHGVRIIFQYQLWVRDCLVSKVETQHVSLDKNLKLRKLSKEFITVLEKEIWNETWL